jgi:two-component system, LytTR family, sensor kinase
VSELLNLIGMTAGIALYAMLLVMVVRSSGTRGAPSGVDPLLLATSVLGLVWNVCALPAYELPKLGISGSFPFLTAAGFSALGLLPAVVVHSVLRGEHEEVRGWLRSTMTATAYAISATAAALHVRSMWIGAPLPSVFAMQLLTYSYAALAVPLALVTRGQTGSRRALWVAALSIFAVSALHLSQFHQGDPSWPVELLGHHASLPLAIAILYQDFPFALADLFLKRALTLLVVVTVAVISVAGFGLRSVSGEPPLTGARDTAVLVTLWVATAFLYPRLRKGVAWFVDTIVLKRPDYAALSSEVGRRAQLRSDIPSLLDEACSQLAPALNARVVRWREAQDDAQLDRIAASVDIPVAEPPRFVIEIGELTAGRRLLSDDRAALETIAVRLGRRIDALRITRERYERELHAQEISKLATEAELRALRSQINPHFLFNALTTIGHLIQTSPKRALETLMRLTSLLRGVLRSEGELTTLGREIEIVEAYLEIERARFDERLLVRIDVPAALKDVRLPPLVLQPLVENAVKHGIGPARRGGSVTVTARFEHLSTDSPPSLTVVVEDSGVGATVRELTRGRRHGVGLKNIERRLEMQYGDRAALTIESAPGVGTTVKVRLPVDDMGREERIRSVS